MRIISEEDNIIIEDVEDFDLAQTLECGQCFHFEKLAENEYGVVHGENLLHISMENGVIKCFGITEEDFMKIWYPYFDLERDYGKIKKILLEADNRLENAMQVNYGVRLLNQDFSETLMSFIISQNKQIPHIKKIVKEISEKYGKYLGDINGIEFYAFPSLEKMKKITEDNYRECKTGFRAPYLKNAADRLTYDEAFNGATLREMSYEEAKAELVKIKGVGEKVANCVLLFSLGFRNAFPVDVWIKRIMEHMYFEKETPNDKIMKFAKEKYGEYGGYAQQYLFYYARENKISK